MGILIKILKKFFLALFKRAGKKLKSEELESSSNSRPLKADKEAESTGVVEKVNTRLTNRIKEKAEKEIKTPVTKPVRQRIVMPELDEKEAELLTPMKLDELNSDIPEDANPVSLDLISKIEMEVIQMYNSVSDRIKFESDLTMAEHHVNSEVIQDFLLANAITINNLKESNEARNKQVISRVESLRSNLVNRVEKELEENEEEKDEAEKSNKILEFLDKLISKIPTKDKIIQAVLLILLGLLYKIDSAVRKSETLAEEKKETEEYNKDYHIDEATVQSYDADLKTAVTSGDYKEHDIVAEDLKKKQEAYDKKSGFSKLFTKRPTKSDLPEGIRLFKSSDGKTAIARYQVKDNKGNIGEAVMRIEDGDLKSLRSTLKPDSIAGPSWYAPFRSAFGSELNDAQIVTRIWETVMGDGSKPTVTEDGDVVAEDMVEVKKDQKPRKYSFEETYTKKSSVADAKLNPKLKDLAAMMASVGVRMTSAVDSDHLGSQHYNGLAFDATFEGGFEGFTRAISDPNIQEFMKKSGIVIINEYRGTPGFAPTSKSTGDHIHFEVGKDGGIKYSIERFLKTYNLYGSPTKAEDSKPAEVKPKKFTATEYDFQEVEEDVSTETEDSSAQVVTYSPKVNVVVQETEEITMKNHE